MKPTFIKQLRGKATDLWVQAPRLIEEQALVLANRRLTTQHVIQRGRARGLGMYPLHRLFELLRVAQEHESHTVLWACETASTLASDFCAASSTNSTSPRTPPRATRTRRYRLPPASGLRVHLGQRGRSPRSDREDPKPGMGQRQTASGGEIPGDLRERGAAWLPRAAGSRHEAHVWSAPTVGRCEQGRQERPAGPQVRRRDNGLQRGGADESHQSRQPDSPLEKQPNADRAPPRRMTNAGARTWATNELREQTPAKLPREGNVPFAGRHFSKLSDCFDLVRADGIEPPTFAL